MARLKTMYRCQDCGYSAAKPMGQCPDCSAWNTMVEEVVEARPTALVGGSASSSGGPAALRTLTDFSSKPVALSEVRSEDEKRAPTTIKELDRLLGGGVVPGQVILLAGAPGIGKSTLMLQTAAQLARAGKVLYSS